MKFTSERHPNLVVHDLGVRFTDGEADVDAKTAAELRKLPEALGVREVGGRTGGEKNAEDTGQQTPRRRSRSE